MKKVIFIILIVLPVLLHADYDNEYSVVYDSVKYYMATDKCTYIPGDSVHMCYSVTNYKSSPILLTFPSTQEFDFYVVRDTIGIWLWSWGKPFFCIVILVDLDPEESFEAVYSWNMTNNYGNQILYGDYEVTGFLATYNNLPLSVDIEYAPTGTNEPSIQTDNSNIVSSPNPFTSSTNIFFSVSDNGTVDFSIYNLKGQKITTITHQKYAKGEYTIFWDGRDENGEKVSPGVYFYKMECDGEIVAVEKCVIIR